MSFIPINNTRTTPTIISMQLNKFLDKFALLSVNLIYNISYSFHSIRWEHQNVWLLNNIFIDR